MIDHQDLSRKEDGAEEHDQVALAHAALPRHAEEIHSHAAEQNPCPYGKPRLFTEEYADDGSENDVERRDERRLARRGVLNTDLLADGGGAEKDARQGSRRQKLLVAVAKGLAHGLFAHQQRDGKEDDHAEQ